MEVRHFLGILALLFFIIYFFKENFARKSYLLFVLYFFPILDLSITKEDYGSFTVFDALSYFNFIFFIKDFITYTNHAKIYYRLFGVLVLFLFIGCVSSDFIVNSIFSFLKLISVFIYAKLLIDECTDNSIFFRLVINALKFGCLISILFFLFQLKFGVNFTFYSDLNPNIFFSGVTRYPSFFQDPQIYAQYLSMSSFLFLIKQKEEGRFRFYNYLFFVLVVIVLFFTGGRSGFLGLCIGLLVIIGFSQNKTRIPLIFLCLIGYVFISEYAQYFSLLNRQEGLEESFDVRFSIWREAYSVFLSSPIWGIGIGNYLDYVYKYTQGGYYIIDHELVYYGTENGYLRILCETGVTGFVLLFAFILNPLRSGIILRIKNSNKSVIIFLIASVFSWLTGFVTSYTLSDKRTQVLLAAIVCLLIITTRRVNQENECKIPSETTLNI